MTTPPAPAAASASPSLLREWNYNASRPLIAGEQPLAPAVVVEEIDNAQEDSKPKPIQYGYPVATFVSNFVRTSIDHIYAGIAERVDEQPSATLVTNSPAVAALPLSVRTQGFDNVREVSASSILGEESARFEEEFDDVEFVFVDGDLVAIPPPPNEDEMEGLEDHARANRVRKNLRGLRKWIKKKRITPRHNDARQNDTRQNEARHHDARHNEEEKPRRKKKGMRRARRRSEANLQEIIPPVVPTRAPITECNSSSGSAVSADFIGNADQLCEADVLSVAAAYAYIETEAEKDVDKISLDSMLCQARRETELEQSAVEPLDPGTIKSMLDELNSSSSKPKAKSDKCPLSMATSSDDDVYNDTLKVVMVGDSNMKTTLARALRNTIKRPKRPRTNLGVDVHTWTCNNINFSIWDVQGAAGVDSSIANSGAHPSTQALFYSPNSLYILVWDLAADNEKTQRRFSSLNDDDDDEDDYNEFQLEEANREADRALESDIYDNVLSWVDVIPGRRSAILPVVTISRAMDQCEVQRRCQKMQAMLTQHLQGNDFAPSVLYKDQSVLQVDLDVGVDELQATIVSIVAEKSDRAVDHVGAPVSSTTVEVMETIRRLKQDHKVILIDHLLAEMNVIASVEDITEALHFLSSIGELLYFGSSDDEVLSRYIILSRKWLVSALSCILRNDLKRELSETRRFMNLQCAYSGQAFPENAVAHTLLSGSNSSCPVLSSIDSSMLWQSMSFMREAADRTAQLSEAASTSTMFDFLERLLVHAKVFLPLTMPRQHFEQESSTVYFVPSLLAQAEPSDVWTYKSSDSWTTTLCHSWLLRDGAASTTMEFVTASLLQDLYEFSHTFQGSRPRPLEHSNTYPMATSSLNEFIQTHRAQAIGRIKIHHVMCWKSSFLVKIGCIFAESESGELRESVTEVFVSLVDPQSSHCVSSDSMGSGMKKLIVCGKGQVGFHGRRLWKGGYGLVMDSVKASLAHLANVDRQVVCPECLAHSHPSGACTWSWDNVRSAVESSNACVRCNRGHLVDPSLLCGYAVRSPSSPVPTVGIRVAKPVSHLLGSVVLVGLWDGRRQQIHNVGSGFVVDKKLGLIVTAGHILFNMNEGRKFGTPYFGLKNAKAVIGVIPDNGHTAVFRYFAEIVAHDIHSVDACVLRISTKMENDVEGEGEGCALQPELPLLNDLEAIRVEKLQQLKMTRKFELEEPVRILGFNQGGEGLLEQGRHVNRCADFAKGYICKKFMVPFDESNSDSSSASTSFSPREEIVVMCPTISGHSGGPCVNDEGKVVGILSRADPAERSRCYLVPASELKVLVTRAKVQCCSSRLQMVL